MSVIICQQKINDHRSAWVMCNGVMVYSVKGPGAAGSRCDERPACSLHSRAAHGGCLFGTEERKEEIGGLVLS